MKKPFVKPFRKGDVVKFVKQYKDGYSSDEGDLFSFWRVGQQHIIDDVSWRGDRWEYSTNCGAWIPHESFELVRECDEKSIKKLMRDISGE